VRRYDGASWLTYTTADGLASGSVYEIVEDHTGNLWFATHPTGVSRYDGSTWRTYTTADGLANNKVYAACLDQAGNLWFGTYGGGASRFDGANWRTYTTADGLSDNRVISIIEDRSGNLWFGTEGGVSRYDGVGWRTFTTADGLVGNCVCAILEDRHGDLWFGTFPNNGVSRYDGVSWHSYTLEDGLVGNYVESIVEDESGNLWFGTSRGVSRFDGVGWERYTKADGLVSNQVYSVMEDSKGNLWFGTSCAGANRYDGQSWLTYTTDDGLIDDCVSAITEDHNGSIWFGTNHGVSQYDGVRWQTYTTADGLACDSVYAIVEDHTGNLWFGTRWGGVSRYDGASWLTYTTADGLASNDVVAILEDHTGNIWFATYPEGVSRYDGSTWRTYTTADGLANNIVLSILEDRAGDFWFGTYVGLSRFDGVNWGTYGPSDGLVGEFTRRILEDRFGSLWFCGPDGVTRHEPDRVPPQTVISPEPARLSASTAQTITFAAAFREIEGITFSHSFDGSAWSEWTPSTFWQVSGLADGEHVFEVKARDRIGNVDATPAVSRFEVDATTPLCAIRSPMPDQAVRDSVVIRGTAADLRFKEYRVELYSSSGVLLDTLLESSSPVTDGVLGGWNTLPLPDGNYELRLSVMDTLGLTGTALVRVVVDNQAPWADETAPAMISVTSGGDIYTTDGEVHVYFPPHAFARETEVDIVALSDTDAPDTLANGARRLLAGYEVSWGAAVLDKPATLEMSYGGAEPLPADSPMGNSSLQATDGQAPPAEGLPVIYVLDADSIWSRLGGTADPSATRISAPLTRPGRYAVFTEGQGVPGAGTLSALQVTPRAFSPRGAFATEEAAISFTLGRPAPVTVKIYNRAGRLVREVAAGQHMNTGANLVRWDGRDSAANLVQDGVYLVVVEALGKKQTRTVAVVR
jgi:ligand-binding sensor domain-containing protein